MNNTLERIDTNYNYLVCIGIVFSTINGIARYFAALLFSNAIIGSYIAVLIWSTILVSYASKRSQLGLSMIKAMSVYVLFIGLMYVLFPLSREWIIYYYNDLLIYLLVGMPMFVLIKKLDDWSSIRNEAKIVFRTVAVLTIIVYLISQGAFFSPMEWGNRVIPITLCGLVYVYYYGERTDYVIFTLLFITALLGGRQSFVTTMVALVVFIMAKPFNSIKDICLRIIGIIASIIMILNIEKILQYLLLRLNEVGIYARALERITDGFLKDPGRNLIYSACKSIISENGIKISGIFADHYYITNMHLGRGYTFAHNLFYEILIDFGIAIGGIIIIALVSFFIIRLLECNKRFRFVFFVFSLYGIARILVSSSVFVYFNFIIYIGFLLNEMPFRKRIRFVVNK